MFDLIKNKKQPTRRGMTLMELLVVIGILAAIAAIAVPSVRIINKERKIRETARQVNTILSGARDSAAVTGFAGVEFVRNTNFVDADGVYYASTVMYRLKARPVYAGDLLDASIRRIERPVFNSTTGMNEVVLSLSSAPSVMVSRGDYIQIDYRGPYYRITTDVAGPDITIEVPREYPTPPNFDFTSNTAIPGPAFQIYRRPVRDEASRIELAQGLYVDLRLSGPLDVNNFDGNSGTPGTATWFSLDAMTTGVAATSSVVLFYDQKGAIDRVLPNGLTDVAGLAFTPTEPISFLIARDTTGTDTLLDNLNENTNLWVTVNEKTGAAATNNVGEMTTEVNIFTRIRNSQLLARTRQSAIQ